jgi:hypothetical protein
MKNLKIALILPFLITLSCDEDNNEKPGLRTKIDYQVLDSTSPYADQFTNANGESTVDLSEGHDRLQMFQALNYHATSNVAAGTAIDAQTLRNMFSNTADPFYDISTATIEISGADLNVSTVELRDVVASSFPAAEADTVRLAIDSLFERMSVISGYLSNTASVGTAGKLGNYLVDERGIEVAQIIQKSLIGALQLDYIGNVLLDEGLDADNYQTVGDKNYTQLEHNWDVAYGMLTLNPVYLEGATDAARNTVEFGAGSYIWEYNKANYAKLYPAFLKGRAAIVNNDRDQYQALATFIRTEFEKAIANAALGYLDKWKTGTTDAARAHAIAEGIGFIYSLRFAELHGGSKAFSDEILEDLIGSANGFWDLDAAKINAAADAISAKFNL